MSLELAPEPREIPRISGAGTSPVLGTLERIHRQVAAEPDDGEVAAYIPELAGADPSLFGIALGTADGDVHEAGDTRVAFTIQSISKALLYGMALEDNGPEAVLARVGVEPTGEAFNSIRLEEDTGSPLNPMVNAGAIAIAGMIHGAGPAERLGRVLAAFERYTGAPAVVDERVRDSEQATGHRNRAIAHLLRNFSVIEDDPEEVLDVYFAQCSILVTCRDLAVIGATLANKGVNPITGDRALDARYVPSVLSVMATCGMYDYAGQWLFDVGLPAKSGVAGGILAVLPGQLGVGCFSPPLDPRGNSVRGIRACREISQAARLHLLDPPRPGAGALRRSRSGAEAASRRRRTGEALTALEEHGTSIRLLELQGDLMFGAAAAATRWVLDEAPEDGFVILDLSRVTAVDEAAAGTLTGLSPALEASGTELLVVGAGRHASFADALAAFDMAAADAERWAWEEPEEALEWCEDRLLERLGLLETGTESVELAASELCRGMTEREVRELALVMHPRELATGDALFREGDPAGELYVISRGEVHVIAERPDGGVIRLTTLGPGMVVGEVALIDMRPRSATVVAGSPLLVYRLAREALPRLSDHGYLATRSKLLLNLAAGLSERLRRATAQLTAAA